MSLTTYIHNSYILEYLSQYGNTAASNMLLDLPFVLIVESHQANKVQHCAFNAVLREKSHNLIFYTFVKNQSFQFLRDNYIFEMLTKK